MIDLDHIVWAAPTLEGGIDELERLTGVRASIGGRHPGVGTRNALISLGAGAYFEILAPDPEQAPTDLSQAIAALPTPAVYAWAVARQDLANWRTRLPEAQKRHTQIDPMQREHTEFGRLAWEVMFTGGHAHRTLLPFLIDWLACPHPSASTPAGCTLSSIRVHSPDAAGLQHLYGLLDLNVTVEAADRAALSFVLNAPCGELTLHSPAELPVNFSFHARRTDP